MYLEVCEASCGRGFRKSSPTAIHHTSLFQYCLDTYKAHGGHVKVGQYSKNSLRKIKDSAFKYHICFTSSTANICYTRERCHRFCQVTGN